MQAGQAMIEFAIILITLVLLIAGGIELAMAAYNGHATDRAASAAAVAWSAKVDRTAYIDNSAGIVRVRLADDVGLGDHENLSGTGIQRANCDAGYDDGLPDGYFYLFNPKPIDISKCDGFDGDETGRSKIDILFNGRQDGSYSGLPNLNRSIFGMYQKVCADASSGAIKSMSQCDFDVDKILLKLPGYLDPVTDQIKLYSYDSGILNAGYPAFTLLCAAYGSSSFGSCDTVDFPADVCWSSVDDKPLACNVKINYKFRHIFESLVLMGVGSEPAAFEGAPAGTVPDTDEDFFNSSSVPGALGSELQNSAFNDDGVLLTRLKARKDFCASYATSVVAAAPNADPLQSKGGQIVVDWNAGTVTAEIDVTSMLPSVNEIIRVGGFLSDGYNGFFTVLTVDANAGTFTYSLPNDPGGVPPQTGFYVTGSAVVDTYKTKCN
jgi:hypothetical protein